MNWVAYFNFKSFIDILDIIITDGQLLTHSKAISRCQRQYDEKETPQIVQSIYPNRRFVPFYHFRGLFTSKQIFQHVPVCVFINFLIAAKYGFGPVN